jgi:hypothetical protein
MADPGQAVDRRGWEELGEQRQDMPGMEGAVRLTPNSQGRPGADHAVGRSLVAHGIMETAPAADGGPYRDYVLTEKGRGLFPVLVALRQWGEDFFFEPGEAHVLLVDRKQGLPVRKLELRAQDGRALAPEDTEVRPLPDPAAG